MFRKHPPELTFISDSISNNLSNYTVYQDILCVTKIYTNTNSWSSSLLIFKMNLVIKLTRNQPQIDL